MTQVFRIVRPAGLPYVVSLALSAIGLLFAEVLAQTGRVSGPPLGVLHPIVDVVAITAAQLVGSAMIGGRLRR